MVSGAVGITFDGDDLGVVDESVDGGCGDDFVAEGFAPAGEGQVRGDQDRGTFIPVGDELEEQGRGLGVQGQVAQFVADQEPVAVQTTQFTIEASGLVGVG